MSAGLVAASAALTRLPSVRAPPAASSDDSVLIASDDAARHCSEDEQVGGIGIDRKVGGVALEHVALRPGRNADHGEGLAAVERRARLGERLGATATSTAPLASKVCTMPRLSSLRSLSTTAIGILRRIWLR